MVNKQHTDGLPALLKQGDSHAYREVYNMYYNPLVKKAFMLLHNEAEAEDLVQNFFADVWQKQLCMQVHTSLQAYLFKAIHNRCLKHIAAKKRSGMLLQQYALTVIQAIEPGVIINLEKENKLRLLLQQMPLRRLQVLRLVCLENKRYNEAAQEMGISVNSVKTHLKLAIKFFRKQLHH